MGTLSKYNLVEMRRLHNLHTFIETGTATGDGTALAVAAGFNAIHTIEIDTDLAAAARLRFKRHPEVQVWQGDSVYCLSLLLQEVSREPALFWLDAHFPGAHTGADYNVEPDARKRLPLHDEIDVIRRYRAGIADVLLIDDARIYEPGPYSAGNLPPDWPPLKGVERSLDFVRNAYRATHGAVIDFSEQGMLMVFPRHDRKAA